MNDNPYQASSAPLIPGSENQSINSILNITSAKGVITIEKKGDLITIKLADKSATIPLTKLVKSLTLSFFKTKRVIIKPLSITTEVSEEKFHETLNFIGEKQFKLYDIKSVRNSFIILLIIFVGLNAFNWQSVESLSHNDYFIVAMSGLSILGLVLTFTNLYVPVCILNLLINILLTTLLSLLYFEDGSWWLLILLFILAIGIWQGVSKIAFFWGKR